MRNPSSGDGAPSAGQEPLLKEVARGFGCSKLLGSCTASQLVCLPFKKHKAEQTEIVSFLEKWLLSAARMVTADCTSSAGQACWVTEGCPLPSQARAGSPASNSRVSLGSWVQPWDIGNIIVEGGLSPHPTAPTSHLGQVIQSPVQLIFRDQQG